MRRCEAADDAQDKPDQSRPEPVHKDQAQHSFSLSSERNADADFCLQQIGGCRHRSP